MDSINVIGRGRVGTVLAARLEERGVELRDDAELVLLCVPDRAIAEVARGVEPGPWVAHVSGATPLAALDSHERRFSMHPLQTFTLSRGAEQLDGAWAAVAAESDEARAHGRSTTRARRSPRTISSLSTARPRACSRTRARPRRASSR